MAIKAHITLARESTIGEIDRRIYGSFLEHLGRAIYGGIYEPDHPTADAEGFRQDVLALVKKSGASIVRYPGGNFVSGYNWLDGIGPREERPRRLELAWNAIEPNWVGVNEFVRWCELAETEPMLAVNLGTGGPDEARHLVEYCNHPAGTAWSDLRRQHGRDEPYGIKTWCLGNEMDGPWQICHKTAEEYGRVACETAKVMKWVDPSIELVACGSSNMGMPTFGAWEDTVLDHTYEHIDYLSLHQYYAKKDGNTPRFLGRPVEMDRFISRVVSICDGVKARKKGSKDIHLSFDEWNVWYHSHEATAACEPWQIAPPQLEDIYTMEDALVVGGMLIALLKHADRVKMACQAQLVNVISLIMTATGGGACRQTIFWPFAQAAQFGRGVSLDVRAAGPTYEDDEIGEIPYLDAVATLDEDAGKIALMAVNRSLTDELILEADLRDLAGYQPVEHLALRHDDLDAVNTVDVPNTVTPTSLPVGRAEGGRLEIALPPASWNVIRLAKRAL